MPFSVENVKKGNWGQSLRGRKTPSMIIRLHCQKKTARSGKSLQDNLRQTPGWHQLGFTRLGSLHSRLTRVTQSSTGACTNTAPPWFQWPSTWLCYLYISRAIPKSPILATLPGPRQVRRQFLAAISLKGKGRKEKEREKSLNNLTVLQTKKKKKSTCFPELQITQNIQKSQCLWITAMSPIPISPHSRKSFVL